VFGARLPQEGDDDGAGQPQSLSVIDSGTTETLAGLIGKSRQWYILDCAHSTIVGTRSGTFLQMISHASAFADDRNIRDAATGCLIWTLQRENRIVSKCIRPSDDGFV
jgi:hypothetical protein